MRELIRRLRARLADFIDPCRFASLQADNAKMAQAVARESARRMAAETETWRHRDVIDRINENARAGALPDGKFVQIDYGRGGLYRETTITADAVRHPTSGLFFVPDGDRVVVQDPMKRPLFELTTKHLTWPNGLRATIG